MTPDPGPVPAAPPPPAPPRNLRGAAAEIHRGCDAGADSPLPAPGRPHPLPVSVPAAGTTIPPWHSRRPKSSPSWRVHTGDCLSPAARRGHRKPPDPARPPVRSPCTPGDPQATNPAGRAATAAAAPVGRVESGGACCRAPAFCGVSGQVLTLPLYHRLSGSFYGADS